MRSRGSVPARDFISNHWIPWALSVLARLRATVTGEPSKSEPRSNSFSSSARVDSAQLRERTGEHVNGRDEPLANCRAQCLG
jgi:hypothetical protein